MRTLSGMLIWQILDIAILVVHSAVILFNCFGMLVPKLRRWNLVSLTVTALCWIVPGYWYGWGYCPLTDWHWRVKEKIGVEGLPRSYVKWMVDTPTGWDVNAMAVDAFAVAVLVSAFLLSIALNVRDRYDRLRIEREVDATTNQ